MFLNLAKAFNCNNVIDRAQFSILSRPFAHFANADKFAFLPALLACVENKVSNRIAYFLGVCVTALRDFYSVRSHVSVAS